MVNRCVDQSFSSKQIENDLCLRLIQFKCAQNYIVQMKLNRTNLLRCSNKQIHRQVRRFKDELLLISSHRHEWLLGGAHRFSAATSRFTYRIGRIHVDVEWISSGTNIAGEFS